MKIKARATRFMWVTDDDYNPNVTEYKTCDLELDLIVVTKNFIILKREQDNKEILAHRTENGAHIHSIYLDKYPWVLEIDLSEVPPPPYYDSTKITDCDPVTGQCIQK